MTTYSVQYRFAKPMPYGDRLHYAPPFGYFRSFDSAYEYATMQLPRAATGFRLWHNGTHLSGWCGEYKRNGEPA